MGLTRTIELTLDADRQAAPVRQARSTTDKSALDPPVPLHTTLDIG
jgi:hypothetical protein